MCSSIKKVRESGVPKNFQDSVSLIYRHCQKKKYDIRYTFMYNYGQLTGDVIRSVVNSRRTRHVSGVFVNCRPRHLLRISVVNSRRTGHVSGVFVNCQPRRPLNLSVSGVFVRRSPRRVCTRLGLRNRRRQP